MSASLLNVASLFSPANLLNKVSSTAQAKAQATTTGSTSGTVGLTGTDTGTTFLNLLVKELQNQDPTAPMDSTAMVGQMISLNQLDQLISINQTLSAVTTSAASTAPHAVGAVTSTDSSSAQVMQRNALLNSMQSNSASQTAADPYRTLDLSTLNIPYGGK